MRDRDGNRVRLEDDRHDFALAHVALAYTMTRELLERLAPGRFTHDDFAGVGGLALVDAAARWDEGRGFKFGTYLKHYVRKHANDAIYAGSLLHVDPAYLQHYRGRDLDRDPEARARRDWLVARAKAGWSGLSLDRADAETGRPLWANLAAPGDDPDAVDDAIDLRERLGRLPARDAEVALRHHGGGEPLPAVAGSLGVTKQRVSQIRARAIDGLRRMYGVPTGRGRAP